jgi:hypothetical protein
MGANGPTGDIFVHCGNNWIEESEKAAQVVGEDPPEDRKCGDVVGGL